MTPYENVLIVPIVMGKEGVSGFRNADRVPMGGARLVRNVSLEDRTMRTERGAASLGTAIASAGRASLDYWPAAFQQVSEMVRPSPRRLSPRNKHEIGALSAVWAEGNRSDHRVLIVVRPRNGGVGAQDAIAERLAECLASSAPIASRPRAAAMP